MSLFDERFLLAAPEADPIATAKHVRTSDLNDQSLLLLEDGHCLRDQALEVCRMSGARERAGFRATSLETLRQMVAAGMGMTLLPELAGRIESKAIRVPVVNVSAIDLLVTLRRGTTAAGT